MVVESLGKSNPYISFKKQKKTNALIVCGQIAVVASFYDRVWKRKEKGGGEGGVGG